MKYKKPCKYTRLYGFEIDYEKRLTDPELRLYHLFLRLVDWDPKHEETFGSVAHLPFRDIIAAYLPWSIGKISNVQRSLIAKGWIQKGKNRSIVIPNYGIYRVKNVHLAEKIFQKTRQGAPLTEQEVQQLKQSPEEIRRNFYEKREDFKRKTDFGRSAY